MEKPKRIKDDKLRAEECSDDEYEYMVDEQQDEEEDYDEEEQEEENEYGLEDDALSVASGSGGNTKSTANVIAEQATKGDYEVFSATDLLQQQRKIIGDVDAILNVGVRATRALLNQYKWQPELLINEYYDNGQEMLFTQARLINAAMSTSTSPNVERKSPAMPSTQCRICLDDCEPSEIHELRCGHGFCYACLAQYARLKIMDESAGEDIACPSPNCNVLLDESIIQRAIDEKEVKLRYDKQLAENYVRGSMLLSWCPAPECCYGVRMERDYARDICCGCGHIYCYGCKSNWHAPLTCEQLTLWRRSSKQDFENDLWIANNAKSCPSCKKPIEKNGGCNHMSCHCGAHFCWLCLRLFVNGNYDCNCGPYNNASVVAKVAELEQNIEKLRQCFGYYQVHVDSYAFEQRLKPHIEFLAEQLDQHEREYDIHHLTKAYEVLRYCRLTLAYSYAYTYFLHDCNQAHIFAQNQMDLANAVEPLSRCLEQGISIDNWLEIKQEVIDRSDYCARRRAVLLEHIEEGTRMLWFTFRTK